MRVRAAETPIASGGGTETSRMFKQNLALYHRFGVLVWEVLAEN
jgi:hypothetical protein